MIKAASLALLTLLPAAAGAAARDPVRCREHTLVVTDRHVRIRGELCASQTDLRDGAQVQLLIHGATYDHAYWDFGTIGDVEYSYARTIAAAGIPTFAIDELGTGGSSHPDSSEVTFAADVGAVHEVIGKLRAGGVEGVRFRSVVVVGNSMGSLVAWQEAATYHDVDGLVITGMVHHFSARAYGALSNAFYSAAGDPKFASDRLDPGYLTSRPGSKGSVFYDPTDLDPAVLARDEELKDTMPNPMFAAIALTADTTTLAIDVPVLQVVGAADILCDETYPCSSAPDLLAAEEPSYKDGLPLAVCVIPGAGHSVSLSRAGRTAVPAIVLAWTAGAQLPASCAR